MTHSLSIDSARLGGYRRLIQGAVVAALLVGAMMPARAGLFSAGGGDDNCTADHSRAWCVMDFVDATDGLEDLPADELARLGENLTPSTFEKASSAALIVDGLLRGSLFSLSSGLTGRSRKVASGWGGVVFMPKDVGGDDPEAVYKNLLNEAAIRAFKGTGIVLEENDGRFPNVTRKAWFRITGGECETRTCLHINRYVDKKPSPIREAMAPGYIDAGKGAIYSFKRMGHAAITLMIDGETAPIETFIEFSSALPEWNYFYFPKLGEINHPFILSAGRMLLFIEPEKAAKANLKTIF